jgi:hypothetical protein
MDFIPDWGEIELKVKMWMVIFHVIFMLVTYLLLFGPRLTPSGVGKKILFVTLSGIAGVIMFASMFAFDWASVLP